ncbi:MAG TPA: aspartyl protease family protein [Hyphomonas sp.]|nr:aspartyl protease family protein [Hyphomonas sp.]HRK67817.1 aspartyl protease family protein [Hyphomonas sp.]
MSDGISGLGRILAALLLLVSLAAPAMAGGRLEIPFRINHRDHMVIDLKINDQTEVTGVIDTAATYPMVDSAAALRSGVIPPVAGAPMINVLGINGDRDFPVVHIGSVTAGNARLNALNAAYNEDIEVPGSPLNILPASAIPGDVLEFDFERGLISTYDGRPQNAPSRYVQTVDYMVDDGLIFVSIQMNGHKGLALIDTGSSITFVNSAYARKANIRREEDLTRHILGMTGGQDDVWVGKARKVRLGDFFFERPNLLVSDPVIFDRLGLSDQPIMVLGLDFLSRFRIQFDRPRGKVVFSVPAHTVGGVRMNLSAPASRLDD